MMRLKCFSLAVLLLLPLMYGCGGQLEPGVLSPDQVDTTMVDQVVKVTGRITLAVENPGDLGGIYLTLGEEELGVRIPSDIWSAMPENEQAGFKEGKTVTVEGALFLAGKRLVVRYGELPLESPAE